MFGRLRRIAQHGFVNDSVVTANDIKFRFPKSATNQPNYAGAQDNERKRHMKKENRDESEDGKRPHDFIFKRFAADANDRDSYDGHDSGLQSVKDRCYPRNLAKCRINVAQRPKNKDRRDDEK